MALISSEFESLFQIRYYLLGPEIESDYAIRHVIVLDAFEGKTGIAPVVSEFTGVIANGVTKTVTGLQKYRSKINIEKEGVYRVRNTTDVSKEFEGVNTAKGLFKSFEGRYGIASSINMEFESVSRMVTYVSREVEGALSILDYNPVTRQFTSVQQYTGALGGTLINKSIVGTVNSIIVTTAGDGDFIGEPEV